MAELEKTVVKKNIVKIVYGESVEVCGVEAVISVEPTEINLKVQGTTLTIKGKEFNVEKMVLETGEIKAQGKVESMCYDSVREKQSIIKRIFK